MIRQRRGFRWRAVVAGLTALLMTVGVQEAEAMGRMCLFSAVRGVVLDHGKPVQGALITRNYFWHWKDRRGADETVTDAQGRFELPAIWGRSLLGAILPHQTFVEQKIAIQYGGKDYVAWRFIRSTYEENSELFGKPIDLRCSLEREPARQRLEQNHVEHDIYGICEMP